MAILEKPKTKLKPNFKCVLTLILDYSLLKFGSIEVSLKLSGYNWICMQPIFEKVHLSTWFTLVLPKSTLL